MGRLSSMIFTIVSCFIMQVGFAQTQWVDDGTDDIKNNNSGDVAITTKLGLGTTSPAEAIEVAKGWNILLRAHSNNTNVPGSLQFSTSSNSQLGKIWADGSNSEEKLFLSSSNSTAAMTIDSQGFVGIGTTSPNELLEVSDGGNLLLKSSTSANSNLLFESSGGTELGRIWSILDPGIGPAPHELHFSANGQNGTTAELVIKGNEVGIGTATPNSLLTVDGDIDITGSRFHVATDGEVGIGTDDPQSLFHVAGAGGATVSLSDDINTDSKILGQVSARSDHANHPDPTSSIRFITAAGFGELVAGGGGGPGTGNGYDHSTRIVFFTTSGDEAETERMRIESNGNVGIGTTNLGSNKLAVGGTIKAEEITVRTGWADFVFEDDYDLMSLSEVEEHINLNNHLPGIPSAAEVEANGVSLGDMQSKLLQKIEELTLYVIAQDSAIESQSAAITELQEENVQLKSLLKSDGQ